MSECTHDCSTCGEACASREPQDLHEKPHELSKIGKVIAVVSGKGGAIALRFDMPASMLKLVSSVIVVIAISGPYLKSRVPMLRRRLSHAREARGAEREVR